MYGNPRLPTPSFTGRFLSSLASTTIPMHFTNCPKIDLWRLLIDRLILFHPAAVCVCSFSGFSHHPESCLLPLDDERFLFSNILAFAIALPLSLQQNTTPLAALTSARPQQPQPIGTKKRRLLKLVSADMEGMSRIASTLLFVRHGATARSVGLSDDDSDGGGRQQCVAVPTECTYEMLSVYDPLSAAAMAVQDTRPHIYVVPPDSIQALVDDDRVPFWRELVFPKKAYALRSPAAVLRTNLSSSLSCARSGPPPSSVTIGSPTPSTAPSVIATFNESLQILKRIAPKVWPGPVLIYVKVREPLPGLTVTRPASSLAASSPLQQQRHRHDSGIGYYTSESDVEHYIVLRSPSHPLTVRVCQEFAKASSTLASSPRLNPVSTPSSSPMAPHPGKQLGCATTARCPMLLSKSESSSSLGSKTRSCTSLAALVSGSGSLLIGWPLLQQQQSSPALYVTSASQVDDCAAAAVVLNGEERREMFVVPTCEYAQPCTCSVWLDPDRRVVRIRNGTTNRSGGSSSRSTVSGIQSPKAPGPVMLSAAVLSHAVRSSSCKSATTTAKERVMLAVLLKWNVVSDAKCKP
jgi:hypothetical protein